MHAWHTAKQTLRAIRRLQNPPEDRRPVSLKLEATIVLVLLALITVLWLPRLTGPLDLRWDAAVYYVLGTALAEGKGYRLLNEPGEIEAVQYPPLLPAFIAAHQWILGTSDPLLVGPWLRVTFFIIFTAYILAGYALFRRFLPLSYAVLATVACLFNYSTTFLSDLCFAEIPFALVTILFVLLHVSDPGGRRVIVPALLATAAYLLRTAGIALFLAWISESLIKRNFKRAALRFLISLMPILAWHFYVVYVEGGSSFTNPVYKYQRADYLFYNVSYARNLSLREPFSPELGRATSADLIARFFHNLAQLPFSLPEGAIVKADYWEFNIRAFLEKLRVVPGVWRLNVETSTSVALAVTGMFILTGVLLQFAQGQLLIPLYIVFYCAAVCVTPWSGQWWRYFASLAPFLTLAMFQALLALHMASRRYLPAPLGSAGLLTVWVLLCLIFAFQALTLTDLYTLHHEPVYEDRKGSLVTYRLFYYDEAYQALDNGLEWVKRHARPQEIVAASMPQWVYLRTGLKAVMPPFEADLKKAQELLDSVPVRYVVVDSSLVNLTQNYTLPLLRSHEKLWSLVYSAEKGNLDIYQRTNAVAR